MNTTKIWLEQHGYTDVLNKIEKLERGWIKKGTKTRRSWPEVLAGNKDGSPKIIEGVKFPVLCAARTRKNWAQTKTCISKNPLETMPQVTKQSRWEKCKTHTRHMEESKNER
jgi:hypothetical protein